MFPAYIVKVHKENVYITVCDSDSGCTYLGNLGPFNANRIGSICIGFPKVAKVSTGALAFDGTWSANLANVNVLIEYILANETAHHYVMQNALIDGSTEKSDIY